MRNDESVMNVDENLLNVVSILTKDENITRGEFERRTMRCRNSQFLTITKK